MTTINFQRALKAVLVHEGGKVDHPKDPGGRTNQGVIQRVYDGYRKRQGKKPQDVYLMTNQERDDIYRRQYWDAVQGDELPAGVDYVVFDGAVNSGPSQSIKWLQRALRMNVVDGVLGQATLAAANAHPDPDMLVADICKRRMAFLQALKTWGTFGKGWTRRVDGVKKLGQAWAMGSVGPNPVFVEGGNAKATIASAKSMPVKAPADAAVGGGVVSGTLGGTLQQAQDALTPLTGSSTVIANVVAALVIVGVVATVGGLVYRLYTQRKAAKLADALDLQVAT